MPQRQYNKERVEVTKPHKRIILPIALNDYKERSQTGPGFRAWVDEMIEQYPELFPAGIEQGYRLHDRLPSSRKLPDVQVRRIKLNQPDDAGKAQVFSVVSSEVMPYMTGYTDEVEKALFLRR